MMENKDQTDNLYYLADYKNLNKESEEEDSSKVYVTAIGEDTEITIPKNLWDFMEENGYDPSKIEEFDKFLYDLEEE
jgi:hypothetical protein